MNYQAIRAALENPLLTAFNSLVPAVPVFFDNITAVPPNTTTEYVRINITFGITNEPTLTSSVDNARGALIIRIFTEKGRGPARNQILRDQCTRLYRFVSILLLRGASQWRPLGVLV